MGEINFDKSNVVKLEDLKISFEAIGDKIIVLYDTYKSGFECETCKGTGKITKEVYEKEAWHLIEVTCPKCEGKKALIIIPEIARSLPSTGYIVSIGSLCKLWTPEDIGTRVVFSPHVGTFIPMKGNVKLKIMREHEPLCRMIAEDGDIKTADFIDYEKPFE